METYDAQTQKPLTILKLAGQEKQTIVSYDLPFFLKGSELT